MKFHKLNILKLIAFLHIFVCHSLNFSGINFPQSSTFLNMITANFYSTSIFIILNGYLLTLVYYNRISQLSIKQFFIKRIKKFYKIYFIMIILSIPFLSLVSSSYITLGGKIVINLLFLQAWLFKISNFSYTLFYWTLSCLVFYYILFVPVSKQLNHLNDKQLLFLLFFSNILEISISYLLYDTKTDSHINYFLHHNPLIRFPEFLGGCIAAILYKRNNYSQLIANLQKKFLLIILLNLLAIFSTKYIPYILAHNGIFLTLQILLILSLTNTHNPKFDKIVLFFSKYGQASIYFYLINGFFLSLLFNISSFANKIIILNLPLISSSETKTNYLNQLKYFTPNIYSIIIICIFCLYLSSTLYQKYNNKS